MLISRGSTGSRSASRATTAAAQTLACALAENADFGIAPMMAASPTTWMFGTSFDSNVTASTGHQPERSAAPANPFRCPPGPYERASLIAYYLKTKKPKSKLIVLDAKDNFSKQGLFTNAWKELYPNLEWVGLSKGGKVNSVEPGAMTLVTDFGRHKGDVVNVIPPQKAGRIAELAGVTNNTGWCPINPVTFESTLVPNVHVVGDATIAGAMPKSAFTANAQAKVCAAAIVKLLAGQNPEQPKLINTCYSLVAPDYGISVANVYRPRDGVLVDAGGGVSPANAPAAFRAQEATFASGWFKVITEEVFG